MRAHMQPEGSKRGPLVCEKKDKPQIIHALFIHAVRLSQLGVEKCPRWINYFLTVSLKESWLSKFVNFEDIKNLGDQ